MRTLLVFLCLVGLANAEPFLVCDTYPASEQVIGFVYTVDSGAEVKVPYKEQVMSDGSTVAVLADMSFVADGNHKITVKAYNMWGESDPVPFDFTRKLPASSTNIRFRW